MRIALMLLLMSSVANAQGYSINQPAIRVGGEVTVSNRVDTSPVSAPGTSVFVTGVDGARVDVDPGPVTITGTVDTNVLNVPTVALQNGTQVSLTTTSLNALTYTTGRGICEYNAGDPDSLTVDTTATNIPSSPLSGRTAVKICNLDTSKHMWCYPLGTVSATAGLPILQHTCEKFDGLNGGHVSCRCESATCSYAYLEEKCYQQAP